MGIDLSIDVNDGYICIRSSGRYSRGAYAQTIRTAVDAVLLYQLSRVLIDATQVLGSVAQPDLINGPSYLVQEARVRAPGRIERLAFLCDESQVDREHRGEAMATEGGVLTRVFTDRDDAVEWLTSADGDS